MKLSDIRIDVNRQEEGAWIDNIPEFEGLRLKVRGLNNISYRKLERKLMTSIPRAKRLGGTLDSEEQDKILATCLMQCCLMDWDGVLDDNDQPLPYSKDMAHKLLFEPEFRRFREAVTWAATMVVEEASAQREDIVKN